MPYKDYENIKLAIYKYRHNPKNREKIRKWNSDWEKRQYPHRKSPDQIKTWMQKIVQRDGAKCRKCGTIEKLTLQHKIPKCVGGKYTYENLEILCMKCNRKEWDILVKVALKFYFEMKEEGKQE